MHVCTPLLLNPLCLLDCGFEEYRPVLGNGPVWVCLTARYQVRGGQHTPSWSREHIQGQRFCLLILLPAPGVTESVVAWSGAESSTRAPSILCVGVCAGEAEAAHWASSGTGWFSVPKEGSGPHPPSVLQGLRERLNGSGTAGCQIFPA